jgi:hypothetical protein
MAGGLEHIVVAVAQSFAWPREMLTIEHVKQKIQKVARKSIRGVV